MHRIFLALAGFFGATSIILGSLASHALKNKLTVSQLATFQLGVQYQMLHTIALLAIAIWLHYRHDKLIKLVGIFFCLGILLFSGTLYSVTCLGSTNSGTAPIGGMAFILGWLLLIVVAMRRQQTITDKQT
jgi:uncharacterized membrane protein YgdD (TMEM256/DUF423 family)